MKEENSIGYRLRVVSNLKFNTITDFAKYLGMKQASLYDYLNDNSKPGAELLIKISHLGINLEWLLTGEGGMLTEKAAREYIDKFQEMNQEILILREKVKEYDAIKKIITPKVPAAEKDKVKKS